MTAPGEIRQQRQSGGVEAGPHRRTGVVDEDPRRGLHHHREPVPDVEHRHPVGPRTDRVRTHREHRQHPGKAQPADRQTPRGEHDQHPRRGGGDLQPPDVARRPQRDGMRPGPLDGRPQRIEHQGGDGEQQRSQRRKEHTGEQPCEDHGDDDRADQRDDERIDERRHQRLLGEDAQRHRRETHRDRDLHGGEGAQPAGEGTGARRRLPAGHRPGGERRHDDGHRHEGQPEARGPDRVGVGDQHRDQREGQSVRGWDAAPRKLRHDEHREHQQRTLRGEREPREQRVAGRGQHRRDPRDLRRGDQQRRARHEGPHPARDPVRGACRHPDVQARDRHEMGDAGHAQRPPVALRDAAPIADGERTDQPFAAVAVERGTNRPGETGAHRMHPGHRQRGRRADAPRGLDVARGDDPAREQPAFVVGAARIAPSAGPPQAHGQAPDRPRRGRQARTVPGEPDPSPRRERSAGAALDVEIEPDPARIGDGQALYGAGNLEVPSFQPGRKRSPHLDVGDERRPRVSRRDRKQRPRPDLRKRKPRGDGQYRTPHRVRQRRLVLQYRHPDRECTCERQHGSVPGGRWIVFRAKRAAGHGRRRRVVDNAPRVVAVPSAKRMRA